MSTSLQACQILSGSHHIIIMRATQCMMRVCLFICLLQGVQEIANSYVDQQQVSKERRNVIEREERGLEKCKAEKERTESAS